MVNIFFMYYNVLLSIFEVNKITRIFIVNDIYWLGKICNVYNLITNIYESKLTNQIIIHCKQII